MFNKLYNNKFIFIVLVLLSLLAVYPNIFFLDKIFFVIPKLIFRCSLMLIIFIQYLFNIVKRKKIDLLFSICLFFVFFQIFLTVINNADIKAVVYSNLMISLSCLIITDVYINVNKKLYIDTVFYYLLSMNIISMSMFVFSGKSTTLLANFYGNQNDAFRYNLPLMLISYYKFENKKHIAIIINIILLLQTIISEALTSSIVLFFLLIYMLFLSNKNIKFLNIISYVFIGTILSLMFVIPKFNRYTFNKILVLVGKSKTASGRFNIYDIVINNIDSKSLIIGHGHYKPDMIHNMFANEGIRPYNSCHNMYLEMLFKYGILSLIFFIILIILCFFIINKCNNIYIKNLSQISFAALILWSISEPVWFYNYLFVLGLMIYIIGKYEFDIKNQRIKFVNIS